MKIAARFWRTCARRASSRAHGPQIGPPSIETWPLDKLIPYARNPRKNDAAVGQMVSSIKEFGFKIPCLVRSDGEVVDGHLRLKAARQLGIAEVPVILCDEWTPAQVKAFRLMVNRSVTWADWDEELLALELADLNVADFDLSLTGFDAKEIDALTLETNLAEDEVPPVPAIPTSKTGDLWICGPHRVLCGNSTNPEDVARLLGDAKPRLMITDPPYGIELDSEWRDRAGLNGCGPAELYFGDLFRMPRRVGGSRQDPLVSIHGTQNRMGHNLPSESRRLGEQMARPGPAHRKLLQSFRPIPLSCRVYALRRLPFHRALPYQSKHGFIGLRTDNARLDSRSVFHPFHDAVNPVFDDDNVFQYLADRPAIGRRLESPLLLAQTAYGMQQLIARCNQILLGLRAFLRTWATRGRTPSRKAFENRGPAAGLTDLCAHLIATGAVTREIPMLQIHARLPVRGWGEPDLNLTRLR
jgi:hypothetical protein